jgi:hypothetical protein
VALRLENDAVENIEVERFGDVVVGASLHGLDGVFHRRFGSHDDHQGRRTLGVKAFQQLKSRKSGHLDVEHRQVVGVLAKEGQGFGPRWPGRQ